MTIYQKAIKVRKVCESKRSCYICEYYFSCKSSNIILYTPVDESIKTVAKAIKKEKWNIK